MRGLRDYTRSQKVVHWLMALAIMLDLFVAQKFGGVMKEWDRLESRSDHATLGTVMAILFLVRLVLRWRHGAPSLPSSMSPWQVRAAHWGHGLLYFFVGFLILSGILTALSAAQPILVFGAFDITMAKAGSLLASAGSTFDDLRWFHEFATNMVIALIVIHVTAAFYHWLIAKDETTQRMLRFWSGSRTTEDSN
ncbi:MAG: cytochrome b/b6 domain-containing protein [Pseudomonadota bacterium]